MKFYISEVISGVKQFNSKLDDLALLKKCKWIYIDNSISNDTQYLFRDNKELLISIKGFVERGKWEYISNLSLLLEIDSKPVLYQFKLLFQEILILSIDNFKQNAIFVSESLFDNGINSFQVVENYIQKESLKEKDKIYTIISTPTYMEKAEDWLARNIVAFIFFASLLILFLILLSRSF